MILDIKLPPLEPGEIAECWIRHYPPGLIMGQRPAEWGNPFAPHPEPPGLREHGTTDMAASMRIAAWEAQRKLTN